MDATGHLPQPAVANYEQVDVASGVAVSFAYEPNTKIKSAGQSENNPAIRLCNPRSSEPTGREQEIKDDDGLQKIDSIPIFSATMIPNCVACATPLKNRRTEASLAGQLPQWALFRSGVNRFSEFRRDTVTQKVL